MNRNISERTRSVSEQQFQYTSAEDKRQTQVTHIYYVDTYFFCLTATSGTEGIKPLKNFVALLGPYRAFFATFCR